MRTAVGVTSIIEGGLHLTDRGALTFWMWASGLLAIASGISLLIGFLTPAACVLVGLGCAGVALSWFPLSWFPPFAATKLSILFMVIIAAAIVLLGPGAFSIDARLFGRREVIIPRLSRPPKI